KLKSVTDTSYFDPEFTTALDTSQSLNARAAALAGVAMGASTPLSPGMQANFKGFTFVNESSMDYHMKDVQRSSNRDHMDEDMRDDSWDQRDRSTGNDTRMTGVSRPGEPEGELFDA